MFRREDYLIRQLSDTVEAIARLVALIQSNRLEDAQEMITQNINLNARDLLLQNDIRLLSKINKQVLEFQIELAFQQIIILQMNSDINLKLKAQECLMMIKNYNQLSNSTFDFALYNKVNVLQSLINGND